MHVFKILGGFGDLFRAILLDQEGRQKLGYRGECVCVRENLSIVCAAFEAFRLGRYYEIWHGLTTVEGKEEGDYYFYLLSSSIGCENFLQKRNVESRNYCLVSQPPQSLHKH